MAQDLSEKIDDYCNDMYGHTNWGYLDTYSKEELDAKDHDIEDNIVYWHEEAEDDEECKPIITISNEIQKTTEV